MAVHKRCSSTPVLPRVTALTVLLEAQHMKSVVHRLFYIAKIGPEMAVYKLLTDHYEKLFHILLKHNLGESVSGLLLIYPSCVIHIIESTSEILYGIIQDLAHIQHSLLQEAKILVISHHVSGRLFPQWYFRLIRLPVQYLHDSARGKAEEMVVEDFLITLLKLGAFLSEILQPGSKGPGESLHELVPDLLVREEIINFLITSDRFQKPEDFLSQYSRTVNTSCDPDCVWPASPPLYL
ncbi:testis-expressed protein 47 isoform X1 [Hyperolius riggenbachi]|uniref:testis-expressed protein 47 isoform X1 n=1 Tax=Hyperolius riggenbachi TaxID=752182 RepID=UPI0035A320BF